MADDSGDAIDNALFNRDYVAACHLILDELEAMGGALVFKKDGPGMTLLVLAAPDVQDQYAERCRQMGSAYLFAVARIRDEHQQRAIGLPL